MSTNPAAMRLTRTGATSSARLAIRAGIAAVAAAISDRPGRAAAAGAAHEQQRAAGPHPADGVLGDGEGQPQMLVEGAVRLLAVQVGQGA